MAVSPTSSTCITAASLASEEELEKTLQQLIMEGPGTNGKKVEEMLALWEKKESRRKTTAFIFRDGRPEGRKLLTASILQSSDRTLEQICFFIHQVAILSSRRKLLVDAEAITNIEQRLASAAPPQAVVVLAQSAIISLKHGLVDFQTCKDACMSHASNLLAEAVKMEGDSHFGAFLSTLVNLATDHVEERVASFTTVQPDRLLRYALETSSNLSKLRISMLLRAYCDVMAEIFKKVVKVPKNVDQETRDAFLSQQVECWLSLLCPLQESNLGLAFQFTEEAFCDLLQNLRGDYFQEWLQDSAAKQQYEKLQPVITCSLILKQRWSDEKKRRQIAEDRLEDVQEALWGEKQTRAQEKQAMAQEKQAMAQEKQLVAQEKVKLQEGNRHLEQEQQKLLDITEHYKRISLRLQEKEAHVDRLLQRENAQLRQQQSQPRSQAPHSQPPRSQPHSQAPRSQHQSQLRSQQQSQPHSQQQSQPHSQDQAAALLLTALRRSHEEQRPSSSRPPKKTKR